MGAPAITCVVLAQRFLGLEEVDGHASNPQIVAMLRLDTAWPSGDEVPWCSAFVNYIAWLMGLPRSKSLRARSWLLVGEQVALADAAIGNDVVVIARGGGSQPGPQNQDAPGHVGFFMGTSPGMVHILGGNQGNSVSVDRFPQARILGIRRLA